MQNSHSVVAGLLRSTNFLAAPFQRHFNPARKRTFQEALRVLVVSGTAVSGKDFVITVSNLVPRASLGPQFQSDSKMVAAPYLTWAGGVESASIRANHYFPGGYRDWEKIVCMRNEKIVCPRGASGKNVCRDHLVCYARFGDFKKIVCTAGVKGKNLEVLNRWWRKLSFLLEIMIPPPPPGK